LGGPIAEGRRRALLKRDDQNIRLRAIEILGNEKVGGAVAVAEVEGSDLAPRRTPGPVNPPEIRVQQIRND